MTLINYNNLDLFSGIGPVPFVTREEQPVFYQNRWCLADKINLNGQITGICEGFSGIKTRADLLISRLSKSLQTFEILEDGDSIYRAPIAKINSVNFDDSNWAAVLPYSIELECYLSGLHSGFYGVSDPVNTFEFQESEDGTIELVHTCEAKGYTTENGAALQNAKDYISTISGWNSQVTPLYLGVPTSGILLKSVQESINRFEASYSLTETYKYDPENPVKGILRYEVSLESGNEGTVTASIDGGIEGGRNTNILDLRAIYSGTSFYNRANELYSGFFSGVLNSIPVSFSFDEDSFAKSISFSVSYDNNSYPNPYLIDTVTINKNKKGGSNASFQGTFKWRGNCQCQNDFGWNQLNDFVNNYDYYGHVVRKWNQYGKFTPLNPVAVSRSKGEDKLNCEITVSLDFEETSSIPPVGLDYFDYTLRVSPAIPKYSSTPVICEGQYSITRLNYDRRARFTIEGSSKVGNCVNQLLGEALMKSEINRLAGIYVIGSRKVLEEANFTRGDSENPKVINFSYTWSSEAARVLNIVY